MQVMRNIYIESRGSHDFGRNGIPKVESCTHRINHKSIRRLCLPKIEQQITLIIGEFRSCAIERTDEARVFGSLGTQDRVIERRVDMIGFEIETLEGGVGRGEDAGFELERLSCISEDGGGDGDSDGRC